MLADNKIPLNPSLVKGEAKEGELHASTCHWWCRLYWIARC